MPEAPVATQGQDQKQEIEHKEAATAEQKTSSGKFKTTFKDYMKSSFGTLIQKPQGRPPNMWKQFISLNNKQRLTFAAGNKKKGMECIRNLT